MFPPPLLQQISCPIIDVNALGLGRRGVSSSSWRATALPVPHRDEDADTVAYAVAGPSRKLLWLPDIDKWEKWDQRIEDVLKTVDAAFLDGTFFSADEIPGRSIAEIPHPLVPETVSRLRNVGLAAGVFFVHLNHTNRLLRDLGSVRQLREKGFQVAFEGQRLPL
jgi:pyrroloquinoline quinone biosynthesis protein B